MTSPSTAPRQHRDREFDLVLFGATGFTGGLTAEYLARRYADTNTRFALAGRDRAKLERVRDSLTAVHANAARWAIVVVDASDDAGLSALCARTSAIATTVGPYTRYGAPLVAACAKNGTDYCDLTGEVTFVRRMIDAHHEEAKRTGARIVSCCGFDSIPSDLGTFLLQEEAHDRFGAPMQEVRFFVTKIRGGVSGGTVASMLVMLEEGVRDRDVRRVLADPYALTPGARGDDKNESLDVAYVPELKSWRGPFVMASVNTRVVRRSNAMLDYRYGHNFRYSEDMCTGDGVGGRLRAEAMRAAIAAIFVAGSIAPLRRLLGATVLPKPGEGPSREQRERGRFVVELLGRGTSPEGHAVTLNATVAGDSDPGYGETAKMLGESAMCLALDFEPHERKGGVLTPASAMGHKLIERLRGAGMRFEV
jgi:short subunit dehydrogenase-like uncharacterized protein